MKIEVTNREDKTVEVIEMVQVPHEGEQFESRIKVVMQVLQVTHTPFAPDIVARILVGVRNSLGLR